jgi:MerR family transcriptional regulator, copper efflux regulator
MAKSKAEASQLHQIGAVAEAVGLSLRTIRYYGEVEVAPPSGRTSGGFRLYTDEDIERLRLVKQMKPLDFTLEEMRDLLETLDAVREGTDETEEGHERLAMYAAAADARCEKLRDQLAAAEGIAATVRREASV